MKQIALDSKPEEPLTHDSRAYAGRLDSATPISVSCSPFTHRVSSEHLNESVGAITCTTPNCAGVDQCNQQYSIYALTDSSGNVSERYAYTAYGQPTFLNTSATVQTSSVAGNRYAYTGREWDQTIGLSHFRARWMSGVSGRFITRDPIRYKGGQNLSEFVMSAPLDLVDPFGLSPLQPPLDRDAPFPIKVGPHRHTGEDRCIFVMAGTATRPDNYPGGRVFYIDFDLLSIADIIARVRCCEVLFLAIKEKQMGESPRNHRLHQVLHLRRESIQLCFLPPGETQDHITGFRFFQTKS